MPAGFFEMLKPNLEKFSKKASHITHVANKFFGQQVPNYIKDLPSIKNDTKRWISNILYFGVGLMYNWAVSVVLRQMPNMEKFPSNVAGMIVLFFILMCLHAVKPTFTNKLVHFIDPYSSFALKSMNIMFVPAVVQIVNNPPTTGPEVGRMICVFIVGYFVGFILCTLLVRFLRIILFSTQRKKLGSLDEKQEGKPGENKTLSEEEIQIGLPGSTHMDQNSFTLNIPTSIQRRSNDAVSSYASTLTDALSIHPAPDNSSGILPSASNTCFEAYEHKEKHGPLHYFAIWCMEQSSFDDLTLFVIFCLCAFIYLPLPEDNPAMPFFRLFLYLSMTILLYSASCRLPVKVRVIIHPIILTSACVMAGIAYFERVKGFDIKHGVNLYKTGITFISLVEKTRVGWPGAGDIFSAAMDVAIISLAFNVYKSRPDSLREWAIVFTSVIPMAFLVMFVTPLFAHAIGCTPDNSIVWSSRSVTTAIGIVIGNVLGANASVVTCIIVFTGIMGPLFGPFLYKLLRVPDDDYMTIGITMGSSSHGVGTAYLISKNPKASGMSSLAFAIFGTVGVIVASIPVLSQTIKHLSGF